MKHCERYIGFALAVITIFFGKYFLKSDMLFLRLLLGVGLGYTLSRGYTGFAGSVNRAYKTGSTRLMRVLMMTFFITALLNAGMLFKADITQFDLWVNPINLGLLAGGLMFGFGMTFSSCCASGVLTDFVTALPRGIITLVFFCFGVFIGFPIQNTASWIKSSVATTEVGKIMGYNGVFLPDLFKFDGLNGYLGAMILTCILCAVVIYFAHKYEMKRKSDGTYIGHFGEKMQDAEVLSSFEDANEKTDWYDRMFVKAWSLRKAAVVMTLIFGVMLAVTKAGWGVSTPYGLWFGQFLSLFGVDPQSLANFTHMPVGAFATPFFEHPISVQNFGIVIGTVLFLLTSSSFVKVFKSELSITGKQAFFYALGGLTMGFGTRLSNGCNVGALYTPIAIFSLSGWVFFIFLVIGGIAGNKVAKKYSL